MNIPKGPILVVEDMPQIRGLLEVTLRFEGYPVVSARDGVFPVDRAHTRVDVHREVPVRARGTRLPFRRQHAGKHKSAARERGHARRSDARTRVPNGRVYCEPGLFRETLAAAPGV